jgi:hypothetical protein
LRMKRPPANAISEWCKPHLLYAVARSGEANCPRIPCITLWTFASRLCEAGVAKPSRTKRSAFGRNGIAGEICEFFVRQYPLRHALIVRSPSPSNSCGCG